MTYIGEKTYFWKYDNGKAIKTEVQTGISDGEWIEVTNRQLPPAPNGADPWTPIDGSEQVIVAEDLSILTDGGPVACSNAPAKNEVAKAKTDSRAPAAD